MKIEDDKKLHSKYSASGSERWLECPGSVALSEIAPPEPQGKAAGEGTLAHTCLETIMKNAHRLPQVLAMLYKSFPSDMVNHGLATFKHIRNLVPLTAELLCETEVRLDFVEPGMFGTTDAAIVDLFGVLWVIDYKYGVRLVDPAHNTQMIYYGLGIAHKYDFNFSSIRLAVAQPRAPHRLGFFRTWDMGVKELMDWELKFKTGVEACKDPFAALNPGRWCFFCKAQSICPAINEKQYEKAQNVFDDVMYSLEQL